MIIIIIVPRPSGGDPIHAAYLREAEASELEQAFEINKKEVSSDLSNKGISNAGATAAAEALPTNQSLTFLDLTNYIIVYRILWYNRV